jgi:hypothetical protein
MIRRRFCLFSRKVFSIIRISTIINLITTILLGFICFEGGFHMTCSSTEATPYSMEVMTTKLFTYLDQNIQQTFGSNGQALLKKAVETFGFADAEKIASIATNEGEIHTLFTYLPTTITVTENYASLTPFARFAKLFAFISQQIVDTYGTHGEEIIQKSVWQFGEKRGFGIAQRARAKGLPNTIENYLTNYDMGRSELFVYTDDYREQEIEQTFTRCPFGNQWADDGMHAYGIHYCKVIDNAIAYGYNNHFDVVHDEFLLKTGACHFLFQMKDKAVQPKYD